MSYIVGYFPYGPTFIRSALNALPATLQSEGEFKRDESSCIIMDPSKIVHSLCNLLEKLIIREATLLLCLVLSPVVVGKRGRGPFYSVNNTVRVKKTFLVHSI